MWNPEIYQDPPTCGQDDLVFLIPCVHRCIEKIFMGQSKNKLPVLEIGLDISTRPAAAHLDLTKPPDLEMTHNATGLGDITKPANLELSDLDVSNNLEITKPEFNNDSCIDQEVNGAR